MRTDTVTATGPEPLSFFRLPGRAHRPVVRRVDADCPALQVRYRKPSRQALRLFTLHRDGRILADYWKGFAVRKGRLVDPVGHEFDAGQLRPTG